MALIRNPRAFGRGILLMSSFLVVLVSIFVPLLKDHVTGEKTTLLHYADNLFNCLAKGSANYFTDVHKQVDALEGEHIDIIVSLKNAEIASFVAANYAQKGFDVTADGTHVTLRGDLAALLELPIQDAQALYDNDEKKVQDSYTLTANASGRDVVKGWHALLSASIKPLQHHLQIKEANTVDTVVKKALEPGYNFFGISAEKVSDNILIVFALLSFYVLYTIWYGFAIFELFEGIGLSASKGGKKKAA